jgi:hypothetical protein
MFTRGFSTKPIPIFAPKQRRIKALNFEGYGNELRKKNDFSKYQHMNLVVDAPLSKFIAESNKSNLTLVIN